MRLIFIPIYSIIQDGLLKSKIQACANLALIKYWGNHDNIRNIPENDSISVSLDKLNTTTKVEFGSDLQDQLILNAEVIIGESLDRFLRVLKKFRETTKFILPVYVESKNNFPTSAGIASSASGFGALAHGLYEASGLSYTDKDISRLSRIGSGSASRTIYPGYAHWKRGTDHVSSCSEQIAPPNQLRILVAITSQTEKSISSSKAMIESKMHSPFYKKRTEISNSNILPMISAIKTWDFQTIGKIAQQEANNLHAVINTTKMGLSYWNPVTVELLKLVRDLQNNEIDCYYTMDAGPQVKIFVENHHAKSVLKEIKQINGIKDVIDSGVGFGSRVIK